MRATLRTRPARRALAVLVAVLVAVPMLVAGCSATIETDDPADGGKADRTTEPEEPAPGSEGADDGSDDASAEEPAGGGAADDGADADGAAGGDVQAGGSGAAGNPFVGEDTPVLNSTCDGQDLLVDEDGTTVIMTGPCGAITVTASWVTVNVDDVERLEVAGDNVTVLARDVGDVALSGSGILLNVDSTGAVEDTGRLNQVITD